MGGGAPGSIGDAWELRAPAQWAGPRSLGRAVGDNSEWAAGELRLFFPAGRTMADEELEALRKQRLAELQAKHGVSAPAARPAHFPARRRPRPRWRARPQAEVLGAAAGSRPAGGEPDPPPRPSRAPLPVVWGFGRQADHVVPGGSGSRPLSGRVRLAPEVSPGLALVGSRILSP